MNSCTLAINAYDSSAVSILFFRGPGGKVTVVPAFPFALQAVEAEWLLVVPAHLRGLTISASTTVVRFNRFFKYIVLRSYCKII